MDTDDMSIELRLAAIINLLSSSALRGTTANKLAALRTHLHAALDQRGLDPYLKSTLQEVGAGWDAAHCHPKSIAINCYPLTEIGQLTH